MPPQGRLAHEASRPLIAEDLDPAFLEDAVLIINVERSGEFVAAWRKVDAGNFSADIQGRLAHEASRPLIAEDLHPAFREGAVR